MDIMELGAIGELVGGVAVIASLIYLGIQVRQSRSAVETESMRSVAAESARTLESFADPESALLFRRGVSAFETLSTNDKWRFHCLMTSFFIHAQTTATLRHSSSLSRLEVVCASFLKTPALGPWWRSARTAFSPSFVRSLEAAQSDPNIPRAAPEVIPWLRLDSSEEGRI